jgi:uncharacterized membrane protein HdeD (DUF308 family)
VPTTLLIALAVAAYAVVSGILTLLLERRAARRDARTWKRWPVVRGLVGIGFGITIVILVAIVAPQGTSA